MSKKKKSWVPVILIVTGFFFNLIFFLPIKDILRNATRSEQWGYLTPSITLFILIIGATIFARIVWSRGEKIMSYVAALPVAAGFCIILVFFPIIRQIPAFNFFHFGNEWIGNLFYYLLLAGLGIAISMIIIMWTRIRQGKK